MNGKKLFRALRNIDPQLILDADPNQKRRVFHYAWIKWGALAACLCFVIVATVLLLIPESPVTPFPHEHVFGEWKTIKEAWYGDGTTLGLRTTDPDGSEGSITYTPCDEYGNAKKRKNKI